MNSGATANQAIVRVLIVEASGRGHRFSYVRLLAQHALKQGVDVHLLVASEALKRPEAEIHLQSVRNDVIMHEVQSQDIDVPLINSTARGVGASQIVIPDGDAYLLPTLRHRWSRSSLPRTRVTLLLMRRPHQFRTADAVKWAAIQISRLTRGVEVVSLRSGLSDLASPGTVPDPVEFEEPSDAERLSIRNECGADADSALFAAVGAITLRKNPGMIVRAFGQVENDSVALVFAGLIEDNALQEIEIALSEIQRPDKVRLVNRVLTDRELDAFIGVSDCVIAAHSNEGPSGVVAKAVTSGTYVIAAGATSLRKDAAISGDAMRWVDLDLASLSRAMSETAGQVPRPSSRRPSSTVFCERLLG